MALEFIAWVVANKKILLASLKYGKRAFSKARAIEQAEGRTVLEIQKAKEHLAQPGADVLSSFAETDSALSELSIHLDNPTRVAEILAELWEKLHPKCVCEELTQAYKMIPSLYYAPHTQFDAVRAVKTGDQVIWTTHCAFLGMFRRRYTELKKIDPLPAWDGAIPPEIDCERSPKHSDTTPAIQYIEAYRDLLQKYAEEVRALIAD